MYKVIHYFTDLQDNNYPYVVGATFPREGMKVSESRIKELSSASNRQMKPLIEKVAEKVTEKTVNTTEKVALAKKRK